MRSAVGYVRVSTDMQDVSSAVQEKKIQSYCSLMDMQLVAIHVDTNVSGKVPVFCRPAGRELADTLRQHPPIDVVAMKLDRLFRNAADALVTTEKWDKEDIGFHLIDHGGQTINTKSATGRMFLTMLAGFAEFERRLISERTSAALQHMKAAGQVYGPTPFGYDAEGPQRGRLVAQPDELRLVDWIFRMRREGRPLRYIAEKLNSKGIRGKKGGAFHASTIRYILKNEMYG